MGGCRAARIPSVHVPIADIADLMESHAIQID